MKSQGQKAIRPFVLVNVAITADGKIAANDGAPLRFSSRRDHEHLLALRATADAVMSGARTIDRGPVTLGPGGMRYRRRRLKLGLAEYNLRVIVSGSGSVDPQSEIFRHRHSPILILTTGRAPAARLRALRKLADEVKVCGAREVDFGRALRWLGEEWGVKRLLCEGGGELNDALFRRGWVDELHLTICPWIVGGRGTPTLSDGTGILTLAAAASFELKSSRRVADELFLLYCRHSRPE
ncbi:MAG: dihydrofolate reductase family protein [Verrucomicrobiota bacterium]